VIKIEFPLAGLDHFTQVLIELHPIRAFAAKKLKLIALHFYERISTCNCLLLGTQRIIGTKQWWLSESHEVQEANPQKVSH
jgi:hypothetical protein